MSPSCFFTFQDRETPLHIAVRTKNTEMVNLLLDHGASPDAIDKVYKSVFFGTVTKVQNNSCNIIVITINRTLIVITILYDRCHRHNLCLHYRCCQGDGKESNLIIHHQPLR